MNINEQLLADGWKKFSNLFEERKQGYAKCFDGHMECKRNKGKRKQIEIYHHFSMQIGEHLLPESWSIECVGQLPDNEWLRMKIEAVRDLEIIQRTVDNLLAIWDFAVKNTPCIEEE